MRKLKAILINAELIIVSLIVIIPIIWIVLASFNQGDGLSTSSLIPKHLTLHNYVDLFKKTNYKIWFMNTLEIAILNAALSVTLIMLTSWIMSRFNFKGKKTSLLVILILSMFPSFLSMTAIYTLFNMLNLIGKPLALVLIYSSGAIPFNVWLVKGYLDGIPKTIDEAAYIDGSGRFSTFFRITIPMSGPIITYCAVSQFMMPWMDYILPNLLLTGDKNKTLAVGIYSMIKDKEDKNFAMFAAGAVMVAIPITIIYLIFQKYLVEGISSGASKE